MNKSTRIITFITFCLTARISLVLLAKYIPTKFLHFMGFITLIPALGFLYLYFSNSRLEAGEAGGKTWWHNLRIIHGLLYLIFSMMAIKKRKNAWIFLLIDVLFGFIAFLNHHFF